MMRRPLFYIVLMVILLGSRAGFTAQNTTRSGKGGAIQRIILHSTVPLALAERRQLNARIRQFGPDSAEELAREAYQHKGYLKPMLLRN